MEESKEKMRALAEGLFRQGLLLSQSASAGEGLQMVSRCWQDAIDLYRRAGDTGRAAEIEAMLGRLGTRMLKLSRRLKRAAADDDVTTPDAQKTPIWSRGRLVKNFKDWYIFFTIGCFGFGGPFAVWSLMQDELVKRRKIMTNKDFLEAAVLGDILPGPVTMDMVIYTGYRLREWWGAVLATFLFIIPSFMVMLGIAMYYDQYIGVPWVNKVFHALGAAVTGIIISIGLNLTRDQVKSYMETGIFIWAFISSLIFKFDMLVVIFLAGFAGLLLEAIKPATPQVVKGPIC